MCEGPCRVNAAADWPSPCPKRTAASARYRSRLHWLTLSASGFEPFRRGPLAVVSRPRINEPSDPGRPRRQGFASGARAARDPAYDPPSRREVSRSQPSDLGPAFARNAGRCARTLLPAGWRVVAGSAATAETGELLLAPLAVATGPPAGRRGSWRRGAARRRGSRAGCRWCGCGQARHRGAPE